MFSHASLLSDRGKLRRNNQDSAYIGTYLFVIADGMGGHAGGDVASAITVNRLTELDREFESTESAATAFRETLLKANAELSDTVLDFPDLTGMGTTVSGMIIVGDTAVIAHIGDSRIYLFRDGVLQQITKDHTFVQRLVDAGKITPEEALVHPRRSVIMRVLGDIEANPDIDVFTHDLRPGDRWMICSDGVSGPLGDEHISHVLSETEDRDRAAAVMITDTLAAGAPDNCTVVLMDPLCDPDMPSPAKIAGAASEELALEPVRRSVTRTASLRTLRAAATHLHPRQPKPETQYASNADQYLQELVVEHHHRTMRHRLQLAISIGLIVAALALASWFGYRWTQTQYFIGADRGCAVVFRGVSQDIGPWRLHHRVTPSNATCIKLSKLPLATRQSVVETVTYPNRSQAEEALRHVQKEQQR